MAQQLSDGNPAGVILGQSDDLVAFYGVTPVAQQSGSAMATLVATIATTDSGFVFATSAGFNALVAQVQALRDLVVTLGLHAGA